MRIGRLVCALFVLVCLFYAPQEDADFANQTESLERKFERMGPENATSLRFNDDVWESIHSAWYYFESRIDLEDSASLRAAHFLGFIECKLGFESPKTFSTHFLSGNLYKSAFATSGTEKPLSNLFMDVELAGYSAKVKLPKYNRDGYIALNSGKERKWKGRLWPPFGDVGGQAPKDVISCELKLSKNKDSLFLFLVHSSAFTIFEFDLHTGARKGSFVTTIKER